jgi:hypothetical protein
MALIDHFAPDAGTGPGENGFEKFAVHLFTASLNLFAKGTVTKAQVISIFNMTENPAPDADEIQLDLMISVYTGKSAAGKAQYLHDIESAFIAYESGNINLTMVATHLEV